MKSFSLFIFIFLYSAVSIAQWLPEVRLTFAPGDSYEPLNSSKGIALNGNTVHVVWADERDGNREIYYKRSTDKGLTWGTDNRFTNNPASSWRPSVSVNGTTVHLAWCDEISGNFEIYYKRSTDDGINWSENTRLTFDSARSWAPSLAVNGSVIHIVWPESRDLNEEVYYKRSSDNGLSWGPDTRLTYDSSGTYYPSVAVSGSNVHVVWYDFRTGRRTVFYKRSTNGGTNWGADTQLTFGTSESYNAAVCVSGSAVNVAWQDTRFGAEEIFYMRSSDGGLNWSSENRMTSNSGISWYPSISVAQNNVHLAWQDNTSGNYEIYYDRSTDGGINWDQILQLTNDTAESLRPSIAVLDSLVHVVWNNKRDGNFEVYYKRNPTGNPVGINNISGIIPSAYSLSQNYPNPFNPVTNVKFSIVSSGLVKIVVYDIMGREVQTMVNERLQPGTYETTFDGSTLTSGVYFYKMITYTYTETKKMILLK
jgi:hypothetical protein